MSAGKLAGKLIVPVRTIKQAVAVRQSSGNPTDPAAPPDLTGPPGGGTDFGGDFGEAPPPAPPVEGAPDPEPQAQEEGDPGWEKIPNRATFPVFPHKESAREQTLAGRDTSDSTYVLWALLAQGADAPVSAEEYVDVDGVGRMNVTGVVTRPTDDLVRIDATLIGEES